MPIRRLVGQSGIDQPAVTARMQRRGPLTTERAAFGRRLRIARERAGVTLEAIAKSTKIKASLLAELENNDLSHWPRGIFRRAFFREYLAAIGMTSESLVAEFVQLFPDDGTGVSASTPADVTGELRLTLARAPQATRRTVLTSVTAALIDLCLVFLVAGVVRWLRGVDFWAGVTVVALAYYSLATAFNRRTPAVHWLTGTRQMSRRTAGVPFGDAREQRRIVSPTASLPAGPRSSEALSAGNSRIGIRAKRRKNPQLDHVRFAMRSLSRRRAPASMDVSE